jgi:hypothetical protein
MSILQSPLSTSDYISGLVNSYATKIQGHPVVMQDFSSRGVNRSLLPVPQHSLLLLGDIYEITRDRCIGSSVYTGYRSL